MLPRGGAGIEEIRTKQRGISRGLPRVAGIEGFNGVALHAFQRQPRLAGIKSNVIEAESFKLYLPRVAGIEVCLE